MKFVGLSMMCYRIRYSFLSFVAHHRKPCNSTCIFFSEGVYFEHLIRMEVLIMKKFLTFVLMLAIVMSLSAVAFADLSPHTSSNDPVVEPEVYNGGGSSSADVDLSAISMPKDVSSDDDDVVVAKLAECPDAMKETAKQETAALKRSGYKIDCGFSAWSKSGKTAACTIKLSEKDVPDGSQIFVNGAAIQAELKDGYYFFEVTLPAIVLVAHK